ncbi:MAG: pantoate--beta-alanine ligase [Bacteroidales bacterium]|nr:pantoate--beta-alanine ligase [Bacteroidales bacterium]MBN2632743.1 pantoate--beta-alanine ligase [Bacteroidales bacterium]
MKVVSTISDLNKELKRIFLYPRGMVPTMGALHKGHMSLVEKASLQCPVIIVSIYVNPTQFNDREDLKNYPRTPDEDLELLGLHLRHNDIVFIPGDDEIYPPAWQKRVFSFGDIETVMEGLHRPGHFNGVAQVVSRLFEIVEPDIAYFGLKDFQQVAIIRSMAEQMKLKVRIEACPIIREPDGLAMSSRNRLLEPAVREKAPVIYRTLSEAADLIKQKSLPEVKDFIITSIEKEKEFSVEYFELADEKTLIPVNSKKEMKKGHSYFGCIAVRAGKIRLIDNILFPAVK